MRSALEYPEEYLDLLIQLVDLEPYFRAPATKIILANLQAEINNAVQQLASQGWVEGKMEVTHSPCYSEITIAPCYSEITIAPVEEFKS